MVVVNVEINRGSETPQTPSCTPISAPSRNMLIRVHDCTSSAPLIGQFARAELVHQGAFQGENSTPSGRTLKGKRCLCTLCPGAESRPTS